MEKKFEEEERLKHIEDEAKRAEEQKRMEIEEIGPMGIILRRYMKINLFHDIDDVLTGN